MIVMHPEHIAGAERMTQYGLNAVCGNPADSTLSLGYMFYSGLFDRFPNLKICALHGGGFLPFQALDRIAVNGRHSFGNRLYDGSFAEYCSTIPWTKSAVVTGSGRLPRLAIARLPRLRVLKLRSCKHSSKAAEPSGWALPATQAKQLNADLADHTD